MMAGGGYHEIDATILVSELEKKSLTFLMIMTRKGSLMARVFLGSRGQVMKLVLTLVPMISRTEEAMSGSVIRLMCPLRTF